MPPIKKVFVEEDVEGHATTDGALEDLLDKAAAFGGIFVPPPIEAGLLLNSSTTPMLQTHGDDTSSRMRHSATPESQDDYMAGIIMMVEEPVATYEHQVSKSSLWWLEVLTSGNLFFHRTKHPSLQLHPPHRWCKHHCPSHAFHQAMLSCCTWMQSSTKNMFMPMRIMLCIALWSRKPLLP